MLKMILFCFVLFCCSHQVAGQGLVDTPSERLLQHIRQSNSDTSQIKFLLALSKRLILKPGANKLQIDSANTLVKLSERLSSKAHDLKNLGKSRLMAAMVANKIGDRQKGLLLSQQALSYFRQINDLKNQGEANIIIGQHYKTSDSEIDKRLYYYKTAVDLFRRINEKERLATTLVDLADLQQININNIESLKNLHEALKIYKNISYKGLTNVYDLIGQNLLTQGDKENALKFELLAERSAIELKDTSLQLSTVYNRISECYISLQNYKKALLFLNKALVIANKYRNSSYIFLTNFSLARVYYAQHEPQKSIVFLDRLKDLPDSKIGKDAIFYNMLYVKNFVDLKKYALAKTYLEKLPPYVTSDGYLATAILDTHIYYFLGTKQYRACYPYLKLNKQITDSIKMLKASVRNELFWFKADSGLGKYQDALKHLWLNRKLSDSLFTLAKNKQVALLQIEYETEQKEQNLSLQAKSMELLKNSAQLEHQKQNARFYMMIGVLAITLIILGFGYSRYRLEQHNNLLLEAKQLEIHQTNLLLQSLVTEKEWLLKEIHHRVKNNLQMTISLLSVQTQSTTSKIAKKVLLNGQRRLHSMSLIHQKLYQSEKILYVEMSTYIREMVAYLKDSFDQTSHITFKTEAEELNLDIAQAVPLGLILNEAITNAIKHAFQGKRNSQITIKLSSEGQGSYHLVIADNGVGLPDNLDTLKESLGMDLFRMLAKQIDSELFIDGKDGTIISVKFKALSVFVSPNSIVKEIPSNMVVI